MNGAACDFARAYARTTGDAEGYFQDVGKTLADIGETITLAVPIIGALGMKD